MARKSLVVKQLKLKEIKDKKGKDMPRKARYYNRCQICGNPKSYMREFGICRICFRKYAREWKLMGVKKSSW